jgi:SAM-dependent methyltransferase
VLDDDIRSPRIQRRFDVVTCISVLEHIHEHRLAVQNICRLLRQGGYLILTVPYNERSYISNIYEAPEASYGKENPYICQVFSRKEIDQWVQANPFQVLEQQYWRVFSGDYWTFGKQIYPRVMVTKNERHQLACLLLQKKNVAAGGDLAG